MEIQLKSKENERKLVALVSPEDFEKVNKYSWYILRRENKKEAYAVGTIDGKSVRMHQFILGKAPKGFDIDHINHNGFDNRRNNLRIVTKGANAQNKKKREGTKNTYIGVSAVTGKFNVMHQGTYIGRFENEMDAAKHYDKYVFIKYNGVCNTNFPVLPEDIEGLTLDDLILTKPRENGLPKNIGLNHGKYFAQITHQTKLYKSSLMKTMEEALVDLEKIKKNIKEMKEKALKEHYEKPIERNDNNQAIIILRNNKKEKVGECIVDDEYWHELSLSSWSLSEDGYAKGTSNGVNMSMHLFLMRKQHANLDYVDHINNNRLDNRLSNLRSVSAVINAHNKKKKEGCVSKYFGVTKNKNTGKWVAQISENGKQKNCGTYENEIDAAKAYNKEATRIYKENANLNIIIDV